MRIEYSIPWGRERPIIILCAHCDDASINDLMDTPVCYSCHTIGLTVGKYKYLLRIE